MKKTLLLLPALALLAAPAYAQDARPANTIGLTAAYARTQLHSSSDQYAAVGHSAYQAGVTADVYLSDVFSFHPELLYTMQYFDNKNEDLNRDINYLSLPLLARFHAEGLFFEAGPQVSLPLTVKDEEGADVKSEVHTASLDYLVGLGYQFQHGPSLGIRYQGGLTNIFKSYDSSLLSTGGLKTSTFLFVLGYAFGGSR